MKYQAKFSNGKLVTRSSHRVYKYAWAVINTATGEIRESGFSKSPNPKSVLLAKPRKPRAFASVGHMMNHQRDVARWEKWTKTHTLEVVKVTPQTD